MRCQLRSGISCLGQRWISPFYKIIIFCFIFFVVTPGTTKKEYRDRRQRLLRYRHGQFVVFSYPVGAHSCLDNYYCTLSFLFLKLFSITS